MFMDFLEEVRFRNNVHAFKKISTWKKQDSKIFENNFGIQLMGPNTIRNKIHVF